ncbi:MAG: N-acetyl sugar amidotransferase [Bacteroidota bacterium]
MDYRVCTRCIMDTTDPDITFDKQGVCSNCKRFDEVYFKRIIPVEERDQKLRELINEIKKKGKGKKYDCIIGVSGGVDSTYIAYLVKKWGLRPLAVHFDNGWNSELAVSNIEKTLQNLDIDLYTHVVDWDEFKDIQLSFLKASTPDAEIPTDHGIIALLFKLASKYNIKHILNGHNYATEATLPLKWGYGYYDSKYIKDVHGKFGSKKIKTLPMMGLFKLFWYTQIRKIKMVSPLNLVDYNKETAMKQIQDELGWVYYGGKHYESIYTRFFQAYILPRKFNIDKRKAHLSTLINSNQINREKALAEMSLPIFPADKLEEDREYVIKKLDISEDEFNNLMELPTKDFTSYKTHYDLLEKLKGYKKYLDFTGTK